MKTLAKTKKSQCQNHNDWWEMGKIYFKKLAIDYCPKSKQKNKQKTPKFNKIYC